jgi:hypothetical protein
MAINPLKRTARVNLLPLTCFDPEFFVLLILLTNEKIVLYAYYFRGLFAIKRNKVKRYYWHHAVDENSAKMYRLGLACGSLHVHV